MHALMTQPPVTFPSSPPDDYATWPEHWTPKLALLAHGWRLLADCGARLTPEQGEDLLRLEAELARRGMQVAA